jgi:hypothetical protein
MNHPPLYAKSSYRFFSELEIALIDFSSLKKEFLNLLRVGGVAQAKAREPSHRDVKFLKRVYDPEMSLGQCQ